MKITAGLGSVTELERIAAAGAAEVFCGYVPLSWRMRYEDRFPLNRREVLFYHVQIGTLEDMKILARKAKALGVMVSVTFNSLYYRPEQLPMIAGYILELSELGFQDYIVADLNLIRYLWERAIPCRIHVSGELGEMNRETLRFLWEHFSGKNCKITRIIFHRQNTIEDMASCIRFCKEREISYEFEAFILNEKCHFTGGFCNSLHCDELVHLCQMEYRIGTMRGGLNEAEGNVTVQKEQRGLMTKDDSLDAKDFAPEDVYEACEGPGVTGCGLCAIPALGEIGIDVLKIVGRGASPEQIEGDAKTIYGTFFTKTMEEIRTTFCPNGCNRNCYYL